MRLSTGTGESLPRNTPGSSRCRRRLRTMTDFLAACVLSTLLVGCANESLRLEELSFDDSIGASREYVGVDRQQLAEAVHKLLWLSGYSVFPTPDGVIGILDEPVISTREAPPPFWTLNLTVERDRAVVHAVVSRHYRGAAYDRDSPAYALFFERLDYLLNLRAHWTTCAEAIERWPVKKRFKGVRILCFRSKPQGMFGRLALVEPDPSQRVPRTTPTPEEWLAMTTRHYASVSPAEVLKAAKEVLTRSQPEFEYRDGADGFVGRVTHRWITYVVVAAGEGYQTHFWEVRAMAMEGGTRVSLYVTTEESSSGAILAWSAGSGSVQHTMPGPPSLPNRGAGVYGLFWDRLDHVLGSNPHWPTCAEARRKRWLPYPDPICF